MSSRERIRSILRFEIPDRAPLWDLEGICEETVRLWCAQGFPSGRDIYDFVGYDANTFIPVSTMPIPSFPARTLSTDDHWVTYTDEYGFTVRRSRHQTVSPVHYYYVDGSVHSRKDWEDLKKRYDPTDVRRLPLSWDHEAPDRYNASGAALGLSAHWGPGRGPKNGYCMGLERFLELAYDDPALVHDMFDFWADFLIELWRPIVTKVDVDYAVFNEDGLAHKTSSLIGPEMYRRLWQPYLRRVIDFLRSNGVRAFSFYTSGDIRPLIPVLMETGFNLFGPLEAAAGLDARDLRRTYGRNIYLYGNIARQALMSGPAAVEEEVRAKVRPLMEKGGYIPAVDDMILPDISFESFMRYVELMREIRFD